MKRLLLAVALAATPATAHAQPAGEIFGGILKHDVDTPLNLAGQEHGVDLQLGWRGSRIGKTPFQPYLFGSLHNEGVTHYAAAGMAATLGTRVYVRPGIGLAIHSGSDEDFIIGDEQIAFGSRVLFAPELAAGVRLDDRLSLEASWVHLSHGQLFGPQNPGLDSIGVRANLKL